MGGRGGRERAGKMNMMQKSVHMYGNAKMIPVETVPGTGGGGRDTGEQWKGELKYDIFDIL
jgi:hypothetical protein